MPDALYITPRLSIPMSEIELTAIRASGPGGQHVNKTSSAIQLRFYIPASDALNKAQKSRLFAYSDNHISENGVVIIKAQNHRSQARNQDEALKRFKDLLKSAFKKEKKRKPTRPTRGSVRRRLKAKKIRGEKKALRGKVSRDAKW
ncbi:alternative ribosome rescue aminoacyl-tRNA hydrolase ArfB [Litorimonas sp.]|uniref:alternative ribosome rescue aminoacyl-tRNA hydrolase ArfB n=1 Tax=Litorimonas sp. TaxID=1892381 RepID=UPI003A89505A